MKGFVEQRSFEAGVKSRGCVQFLKSSADF